MTRPKILGVAHLAVFVSDLAKARAFYEAFLGFEEPFTLPKPDGSVEIAFVKINDRQWIELFNRPSEGEGQLNHIAIYTDDADRMRDYLASQSVAVPERVGKGRTGNKNFMVKDPDGHNVEIVEYCRIAGRRRTPVKTCRRSAFQSRRSTSAYSSATSSPR